MLLEGLRKEEPDAAVRLAASRLTAELAKPDWGRRPDPPLSPLPPLPAPLGREPADDPRRDGCWCDGRRTDAEPSWWRWSARVCSVLKRMMTREMDPHGVMTISRLRVLTASGYPRDSPRNTIGTARGCVMDDVW